MKSAIKYIECKGFWQLTGDGRIGRVRFSKSGKSIYYGGVTLQSLAGFGYKANYFNVETGCHYWVSGPKKNGQDSLYPGIVEIDEDCRVEYWKKIRRKDDCVELKSYRSEGKHGGWRQQEFKPR